MLCQILLKAKKSLKFRGFLEQYINKLFTVHCLLLLQTFRTTITYNPFKYKYLCK